MNVKRDITEYLQLPRDFALGAVTVTASGRNDLTVENYKGILEYTSEKIVVQTKDGVVEISGCDLRISCYTADEMQIEGKISEILYR